MNSFCTSRFMLILLAHSLEQCFSTFWASWHPLGLKNGDTLTCQKMTIWGTLSCKTLKKTVHQRVGEIELSPLLFVPIINRLTSPLVSNVSASHIQSIQYLIYATLWFRMLLLMVQFDYSTIYSCSWCQLTFYSCCWGKLAIWSPVRQIWIIFDYLDVILLLLQAWWFL